jgi:pimeloyl-ACP methyl ester carboxylesterase
MNRKIIFSLILILAGSLLASFIQTDSGNVKVQDVRFTGSAGQSMSGLLYIPEIASTASPQPAVLAIHGYINSRETQSGFAIELSRRGFVVLALDQTGHGFSDPPAFAHGFGGPDGLAYLRNLPFVDRDRVALEGHSMGGWASLMAASAYPDGYKTIVLEGSSTGTLGTAEGSSRFPRNLLLVFSRFDEFSSLMWGADIPADIVGTEKLKKLFNTSEDVVVGQTYGNINDGNARKLAMPAVTHPGDHHSPEAIGHAVTWLQDILKPELSIEASDQVWHWKELGTFLALLGFGLLVIPLSDRMLSTKLFETLPKTMPAYRGSEGKSWYVGALLAALIPILTFFPFQTIGSLAVPANSLWSQDITNGILFWMLGNAVISSILFGLWIKFGKNELTSLKQLGVGSRQELLRSLGFAMIVVGILYLLVILVDFFFLTDFRLWVVALKSMSRVHFFQFIFYAPAFCLFFIVLGATLHTQLRQLNVSVRKAMLVNAGVLSMGFILLLIVQYAPLFAGGTLALASQPLLTIVAIQFVPLMILIGCVSTWSFYRTGSVYPGGFINGLFVCWYVVAGQATQGIPLFG